MPKAKASPWVENPVLDFTLKELFAKGLTFGQIAAELWKLGHRFTRNAVIGRAKRLHLPGRAPSGGKLHQKKIAESGRGLAKVRVRTPAVAIPKKPTTAGAFLAIALVDLIASDCRYPHGEGSKIRFCGQPALEGSALLRRAHEALLRSE